MKSDATIGSQFWLVGLALICPPLGIALSWVKPNWRFFLKLLVSLGLVVLSSVYLVLFFGLQIERDGSSWRPIFSFQRSYFEHGSDLARPSKSAQPAKGLNPTPPSGETQIFRTLKPVGKPDDVMFGNPECPCPGKTRQGHLLD